MAKSDLKQADQNQSGADPDPDVRSKPERRRFTAEYKRRILKEVAACKDPGQIVALLSRKGLYSSNLRKWRKQMASGYPNHLVRPLLAKFGGKLLLTFGNFAPP